MGLVRHLMKLKQESMCSHSIGAQDREGAFLISLTLTPLSVPSSSHLNMAYSCFGRPSQKTTPRRPSTTTLSPTFQFINDRVGAVALLEAIAVVAELSDSATWV